MFNILLVFQLKVQQITCSATTSVFISWASKAAIYQHNLGTHVLAFLVNYLPTLLLQLKVPLAHKHMSCSHLRNTNSPPALTVLGDPVGPVDRTIFMNISMKKHNIIHVTYEHIFFQLIRRPTTAPGGPDGPGRPVLP